MSTIGYVRVSTDEQTTENQQQQIAERYHIDKWFIDEATSGTTKAIGRHGWSSLMNYVREGDTVVCVAVDRIGRNTIDLLQTVEALKEKGVSVVSMREGFDLSTPAGEAMLTIMAALAKMELSVLDERRKAGIKRAKSHGIHCGRPAKATTEDILLLIAQGKSRREIEKELGISKATYFRLKKF
ncbi:TPA: recombinase family protein [Klebsiella quasipneumoniae]|nr:recombinase family protein [Klebsiella quasipneumoniae]